MHIAVIGGGASGILAAIAAKNENNRVTVYEKEKRIGRKILATGNGRCNMTNINADINNYHGRDVSFMRGVINRFWVEETLQLFSQMGILWKEEERGKVYPYSDTASSVLDILRHKLEVIGVNCRCEFAVKAINKQRNGFVIMSSSGEKCYADRVIVATGGKAGASLGSDGSGYNLLKGLGHSITDLKPSLVQIKTETDFVKKLKGIKVNASVTLGNKTETGEVLFADYGISGPPVFSLSSYIGDNKFIYLDIMPEYSLDEIIAMLKDRCAYLYNTTREEYFTGMLNKRVGQAVLKYIGIEKLSRKTSSLTDCEIKKISETIKGLKLKITGTASWNNAQVTKGGAVVSEFNPTTMESKSVKGLYACGEVLDIDGDCGGYNLQWAWSSGYIAGVSSLRKD